MPKIYFLIFLSILQLSCARINQESRDYYQDEKKMRHGIIPSDSNFTVKQVQEKLDQSSVQRGLALYQKNCLECHGPDGEGQSSGKIKGANLKKLASEVNNFKFFISISQWQGDMPGWKSPLNENEREDLANYIKSLAQKK